MIRSECWCHVSLFVGVVSGVGWGGVGRGGVCRVGGTLGSDVTLNSSVSLSVLCQTMHVGAGLAP